MFDLSRNFDRHDGRLRFCNFQQPKYRHEGPHVCYAYHFDTDFDSVIVRYEYVGSWARYSLGILGSAWLVGSGFFLAFAIPQKEEIALIFIKI